MYIYTVLRRLGMSIYPPNHFQMESAGGLKRRLLPETKGEFDP